MFYNGKQIIGDLLYTSVLCWMNRFGAMSRTHSPVVMNIFEKENLGISLVTVIVSVT